MTCQCQHAAPDTGRRCPSDRAAVAKASSAALLEGVLVHALQGLCQYTVRLRSLGAPDDVAARFVVRSLAVVARGTRPDAEELVALIHEAASVRDRVRAGYEAAAAAAGMLPEEPAGAGDSGDVGESGDPAGPGEERAGGCGNCAGCDCGGGKPRARRRTRHPAYFEAAADGPAAFVPAPEQAALLRQAAEVAACADAEDLGHDVAALRALLVAGLAGLCARVRRAAEIAAIDPAVSLAVESALDHLATDPTDSEKLLRRCLSLGRVNLRVAELVESVPGWPRTGALDPGEAAPSEAEAAVAMLTLLAQGERAVRFGPALPAFLTPELVDVLAERLGFQVISGEAGAVSCAR